jgi:hypothetical protein
MMLSNLQELFQALPWEPPFLTWVGDVQLVCSLPMFNY